MVKRAVRRTGYFIAIVVNIVLIYVFNNLVNWHVPFITERFSEVLWAFNLSIGATIIVNALYLIQDTGRFRHLTQMVLAVLGFNSVYQLYTVFPFVFNSTFWQTTWRLVLILASVGTAFGFVVELVKFIAGKK
jgi:hypothetical protein